MKAKKTAVPPRWEEWGMFHESKGCPEPELGWCYLYESWREWVRERRQQLAVARWCKTFNADYGAFERKDREYHYTMSNNGGAPSGFPFWIFNDFPEFPNKPWLLISQAKRKKRLRLTTEDWWSGFGQSDIEGDVMELRVAPDHYVRKVTRKDDIVMVG